MCAFFGFMYRPSLWRWLGSLQTWKPETLKTVIVVIRVILKFLRWRGESINTGGGVFNLLTTSTVMPPCWGPRHASRASSSCPWEGQEGQRRSHFGYDVPKGRDHREVSSGSCLLEFLGWQDPQHALCWHGWGGGGSSAGTQTIQGFKGNTLNCSQKQTSSQQSSWSNMGQLRHTAPVIASELYSSRVTSLEYSREMARAWVDLSARTDPGRGATGTQCIVGQRLSWLWLWAELRVQENPQVVHWVCLG